MDQLRLIGDTTLLKPSKEEYEVVLNLKQMLTDYLVKSAATSQNETVRQAVVEFSNDYDILLKYIRGRKQNLQKALDSLISFANVKYKVYPDLFPDVVPDYVHYAVKNEILTVLKNKDRLGRTIVLLRTYKWDVNRISLEEIICAGRYITDALMNMPDFLLKGVIILLDCNGASVSQARHFTIPTIAKFINVFWQAYPIQIKGLYHVNAPIFVKPVYTIVKPFLPAKLKERVLITPGVSELYKHIEPDILPESLGGVLKDEDATTLSFLHLPD